MSWDAELSDPVKRLGSFDPGSEGGWDDDSSPEAIRKAQTEILQPSGAMGLESQLQKKYGGTSTKRRLAGTQMLQGSDKSELEQQYPTLGAAFESGKNYLAGAGRGLLGVDPDEAAGEGSVLDPAAQKRKAERQAGAEVGYGANLALQALPLAGPAAKGAKFLAPKAAEMTESYLGKMGMMPGIVEAGPGAPARDMAALKQARKMDLAKTDPEQIAAATGWKKGAKGWEPVAVKKPVETPQAEPVVAPAEAMPEPIAPIKVAPSEPTFYDSTAPAEIVAPAATEPLAMETADAGLARHALLAERGERETAQRTVLSSAEKQTIRDASKELGVTQAELEGKIRQNKIDNPSTGDDPWAPLTLNRVKPKKGGGYDIEYEKLPYSFEKDSTGATVEPGTPAYDAHVQTLAEKLKDEVKDIYKRFQSGDKVAENIISQASWYKEMRSRLRQEFGGLGDMFADLLGATSPNTPVRENWKNGIDLLRKATKGDFDQLIPQWENWYNNLNEKESAVEKFFNEQLGQGQKKASIKRMPEFQDMMAEVKAARDFPDELLPLKESGAKYGFNGQNGVRALLDLFRVVKDPMADIGRGATAPKAINFSGNLIGYADRATIDVWAARLLQRLAGKERIPSMAESGVSGSLLPGGRTTGQFGLGQDVFSEAKNLIRADADMSKHNVLSQLNDDDLQALVWFKEKELWTKKNWTSAAGEGGSFEFEADLAGQRNVDRVNELRKIADSGVMATAEQKADATSELARIADARQALRDSKNKPDLTTKEKNKIAAQIKDYDKEINYYKRILAKPSPEEVSATRAGALGELEGMKQTLERYQAGLSIQRPEFLPADQDMANLGLKVRDAIMKTDDGATVLGSKALSTEGRYGDPERALDVEAVVRQGYDPTPLVQEIVTQAKQYNQDSAFLSRVLRQDEVPNPAQHRPGVEIYFQDAKSLDNLQPILDNLAKQGVEFYTVVVDGRRSSQTMAGGMPPAVGVRFQLVPEFEQRYGMFDWDKLTNKQMVDEINKRAQEMNRLAARVAAEVPGVSNAQRFWYDTEVLFKNQYEGKLNEIKNASATDRGTTSATRGRVWQGKSIREGVKRAAQWAKESD